MEEERVETAEETEEVELKPDEPVHKRIVEAIFSWKAASRVVRTELRAGGGTQVVHFVVRVVLTINRESAKQSSLSQSGELYRLGLPESAPNSTSTKGQLVI